MRPGMRTTHENPGIFGSLLHGMGFGLVPLLSTEATTPCDRQVIVSDGVFTCDVTGSISNRRIVRPAAVPGLVIEEIWQLPIQVSRRRRWALMQCMDKECPLTLFDFRYPNRNISGGVRTPLLSHLTCGYV